MARRGSTRGRKCVRKKRTRAGMRCAKYSGGKGTRKRRHRRAQHTSHASAYGME